MCAAAADAHPRSAHASWLRCIVDAVGADRDAPGASEGDASAIAVDAANREFYRAFQDGDFVAMERLWDHGAHVRCVHPGWEMLSGWEQVRGSWERILSGPDIELEIEIDDVDIRAGDDVAWVSCIERLSRPGLVSEVVATNVFERSGDGTWRMVQHHASPILNRRAEVIARGDVN